MNPELVMPTEELVGKAINVLADVVNGKRVAAAKVTAAASLLDAYAHLRPLEQRKIWNASEASRTQQAPKITPPPGAVRTIS